MNEEVKKDYSLLIAKKSEKLVTALYLVTDLMSDNEPIKHGLRKNAVALLSSMNSLAQLDVKDRVLELKLSLKSVTEIISLLHVAITTGIVSKMNGDLLMEGFRSLQLVLEKKQPLLQKEMFRVEDEEMLAHEPSFTSIPNASSYDALTPLSLARLHGSKEELRRTQDMLRQSQLLTRFERVKEQEETKKDEAVSLKDTELQKTKVSQGMSTHAVLIEHAYNPPLQTTTSFQMKKLSRRDQIISLFIHGVDISIKDIAAKVKGCSEKTIQRELNALVADGIIDRIGEKRWSRYMLK